MRTTNLFSAFLVFSLSAAAVNIVACSDDDSDTGPVNTAGTGGSANGGSSGVSGQGGTSEGGAGTAGTAGSAGSAGTAGSAGNGGTSGTAGAAGATGGASGAAGQGGAAAAPTDANSVAELETANQGEVAEGDAATSKASDSEVKQFAQKMVTDHTSAETMLTTLATTKGIVAAPDAFSQMLQAQTQADLTAYSTLTGAAFDKAYIAAQVKAHQAVLNRIDQAILPHVQDADLKALVMSARTMVNMHLQTATALQTKLGA